MKKLSAFKLPIAFTALAFVFVVFQNFTTSGPPKPPLDGVDDPTPTPAQGLNIPFPSGHSFSLAGGLPSNPQTAIAFSMTLPSAGELKVKVNAESAIFIPTPNDTPQFQYGCMAITVSVNGVSKTTGPLRVPGATQKPTSKCLGSPEETELTFSNVSNLATVTLKKAQSDNCHATDPSVYGCSITRGKPADRVNGIVEFYRVREINFDANNNPAGVIKTITVPNNPYNSASSFPLQILVSADAAKSPGQSQYGCLSVDLTVNGSKINSGILKVPNIIQSANSPCLNAPTQKVISFTGQYAAPNSSFTVKVNNPWYDSCGGPYNPYGCTMSAVRQSDFVSGKIDFGF